MQINVTWWLLFDACIIPKLYCFNATGNTNTIKCQRRIFLSWHFPYFSKLNYFRMMESTYHRGSSERKQQWSTDIDHQNENNPNLTVSEIKMLLLFFLSGVWRRKRSKGQTWHWNTETRVLCSEISGPHTDRTTLHCTALEDWTFYSLCVPK